VGNKLPRRQEEALNHIIAFVREHHYVPSVRELSALMGLKSASTVHSHLRGLEERGLITRPARRSRSIQLSPYEVESLECEETIPVPLVSRVHRGTDVLDPRNYDATIPVARSWLGACNGREWLFHVTVDAACGDYQIGDYVLLRAGAADTEASSTVAVPEMVAKATIPPSLTIPVRTSLPPEGEVIALLRDGAIMLKPFARDDQTLLIGRVIGLFRPPLAEWR
jgi:SOS-response transcriptional repressor LexA